MNLVQSLAAQVSSQPSILNPEGPVGQRIEGIFLGVMWTSFVVGGAVFLALIFTFFKFRAKKGDTSEGAQWHENTKLEIAWTIFPTVLFLTLFTIGAVNVNYITNGPQPNTQTVKNTVIGHQFFWEYEYNNITLKNGAHPYGQEEIVIPDNTTVDLTVLSEPTPLPKGFPGTSYPTGVNHSFYVPELAAQINAIPGQSNFTWMDASQPGVYWGQCTELCGEFHDQMLIEVDAVTPAEYRAWVQTCEDTPLSQLQSEGYKVGTYAITTIYECPLPS